MSNISNLTKCSIDSIKLRIPLYLLDSYDTTIIRNQTTINTDTDEIEREFKETSKKYQFDHFKLDANIFRVNSVDCLILLINSKHLGERYFEGITLNTIKIIYHILIQNDIMQCSFDTLMKAQATDTDFKKDFHCIIDEYKQMIRGLFVMGKASNIRDRGARKHKSDLGIEFNKRASGTIANPFTKVYHKQIELEQNSFDFSDYYLNDINYKDVIRIETTIKDKQHFKSVLPELKDTNLSTILSLSTKQKDVIMSNGFNRNLLPRINNRVYKKEGLNSRELFDLQLLDILINDNNYTFEKAINQLLVTQNCKVAKSRLKSSMSKIYSDHINEINYVEKSNNINLIYDQIGWN